MQSRSLRQGMEMAGGSGQIGGIVVSSRVLHVSDVVRGRTSSPEYSLPTLLAISTSFNELILPSIVEMNLV